MWKLLSELKNKENVDAAIREGRVVGDRVYVYKKDARIAASAINAAASSIKSSGKQRTFPSPMVQDVQQPVEQPKPNPFRGWTYEEFTVPFIGLDASADETIHRQAVLMGTSPTPEPHLVGCTTLLALDEYVITSVMVQVETGLVTDYLGRYAFAVTKNVVTDGVARTPLQLKGVTGSKYSEDLMSQKKFYLPIKHLPVAKVGEEKPSLVLHFSAQTRACADKLATAAQKADAFKVSVTIKYRTPKKTGTQKGVVDTL